MGIKKINSHSNLTVLYVHPKIMTPEELRQSYNLIENLDGDTKQINSVEIENEKSLQEYFNVGTLNLAKVYESRDPLGFLCANTEKLICGNPQFMDYLLIRKGVERSVQLRVYRRFLLLIGRDFGIAMDEESATFKRETKKIVNDYTDEYGNVVYPDKEHVKRLFRNT